MISNFFMKRLKIIIINYKFIRFLQCLDFEAYKVKKVLYTI